MKKRILIYFIIGLFLINFTNAQSNCQVSGASYTQGKYGIIIEGQTFDSGSKVIIKNCLEFRVTGNTFKNQKNGIHIRENSRGVIDNNIFMNIQTYGISVSPYGKENQEASWAKPLKLGMDSGIDINGDGKFETADAVYIEDNLMEMSSWHHIASSYGSRYVARHNTLVDKSVSVHAIDAHGAYVPNRGSRSYEIYNNVVKADARSDAIVIRGGDGVIFGNTADGDFSESDILLVNEGAVSGLGCNCGSYPCPDQIREAYIWGNTDENGQPTKILNKCQKQGSDTLQENRNYFILDNNPDFTRNGNTWTRKNPETTDPDDTNYNYLVVSYTPFCYPHPLVSGIEFQCNNYYLN